MAQIQTILLFGGSGFIGTQLALHLREGYKVFVTHHERPIRIPGTTPIPLNVENRMWIKTVIAKIQPDIMIYAAGSPPANYSTSGLASAHQVHVAGPANIMSVAEILQPRFIYLSNPYVFEGTHGNYAEGDLLLPRHPFGKLKFEAENIIRAKSINSVIIRSSPLLGRGNGFHLSFLDQIRMRLDRGERVELSQSEIHSFTSVAQLTDLVSKVIASGVRNRVFHLGGKTKLTPYELGKFIAQRLRYDEKLIAPVSAEDARNAGVRSERKPGISDYSLNFSAAVEALKLEPLLLEQSFDLIQKKLVA